MTPNTLQGKHFTSETQESKFNTSFKIYKGMYIVMVGCPSLLCTKFNSFQFKFNRVNYIQLN